jgi:hypothetical protein
LLTACQALAKSEAQKGNWLGTEWPPGAYVSHQSIIHWTHMDDMKWFGIN